MWEIFRRMATCYHDVRERWLFHGICVKQGGLECHENFCNCVVSWYICKAWEQEYHENFCKCVASWYRKEKDLGQYHEKHR